MRHPLVSARPASSPATSSGGARWCVERDTADRGRAAIARIGADERDLEAFEHETVEGPAVT